MKVFGQLKHVKTQLCQITLQHSNIFWMISSIIMF